MLYANSEQSKIEIKKAMPPTIAAPQKTKQNQKFLGINLTKERKAFYDEIHKKTDKRN